MHPVTGMTGLHVTHYARQLDDAGLSPALRQSFGQYGGCCRIKPKINFATTYGASAAISPQILCGESSVWRFRNSSYVTKSLPVVRACYGSGLWN